MKDTIKKVLKEQNKNEISFGDSVLPRYINPDKITTFTISKYKNRGYQPYYVENGFIKELPSVLKNKNNSWGYIYFFNGEEIKKINKLQNKVEELMSQIKKQMELVNQYVMSYIHDKII